MEIIFIERGIYKNIHKENIKSNSVRVEASKRQTLLCKEVWKLIYSMVQKPPKIKTVNCIFIFLYVKTFRVIAL